MKIQGRTPELFPAGKSSGVRPWNFMIFCTRCGTYSAKGAQECPKCHAGLTAVGHDSFSGAAVKTYSPPKGGAAHGIDASLDLTNYGGFLNRWLASIVDAIIIVLAFVALGVVFIFVLPMLGQDLGAAAAIVTLVLYVLAFVAAMVYEPVMIAKRGATYGKAFRKLKVVRANGEAVSAGRAVARTLVKSFVSPILLIGFLMALFSAKKQALHDLLADTIVVKTVK